MKLLIVIGTRPNFIKVSPFIKRLGNGIEYILVHTGQHYDYEMSDQFFKELEIPLPDINLDVGSFPLNLRISLIMERLEAVCKVENPDFIIVVGDVDSTLAGALTAVRLGIKLIHIESGLRSFDWTMPEEINRVITDRFSNYLFVTEPSGIDNLEKEKVEGKKYLVGNVMADCLFDMMPLIKETERKKPYILLTLHRQSNVDDKSRLYEILSSLQNIDTNIVFPIHPRTKARIEEFGFEKMLKNIDVIKSQGYLEFLSLLNGSSCILTDSGGVQVESSLLNIPCLTLRNTTEHHDTIEYGTNMLIIDMGYIENEISHILCGKLKKKKNYKWWDGKASNRIIDILEDTEFQK